MGYETLLIVGTPCQSLREGYKYVLRIAEIDLCKAVFSHTWIDESDKGQLAEVVHGGDQDCIKDLYGSPLYCVSPQKVLDKMKAANKGMGKDGYRRYNAAIPMLESLINDFPEGLTCVLFGC
jgi:hypothetical protein